MGYYLEDRIMNLTEMSDSSWIKSIDRKGTDVIMETHSGYVYVVKRVPDTVWEEWNAAPSAGSYFAKNIKLTYQINKVTG